MAEPVLMPKQGQSVESCIITEWYKKKGDTVKVGDILFAYETDKASFEEEAIHEGILLDVFFDEGDEVPVLTNVGAIGKEGDSFEEFRPGGEDEKETAPTASAEVVKNEKIQKDEPTASAVTPAVQNQLTVNPTGKVKASPRAKRLANEKGVPYETLVGSGPEGRIIVRDIENAIENGIKISPAAKQAAKEEKLPIPAQGTGLAGSISYEDLKAASDSSNISNFEDVKLTNIRKLIAKSMFNSLQNSAQLTHHLSADARKILAFRQKVKKMQSTGYEYNITLNDMVCYAVIKALKKNPDANAQFLGDSIRKFKKVHLGLAVDTERGLMVPALKDADDLSIEGLSSRLKAIANDCKTSSVNPDLLASTAATFTVSNLGNYGVEMFTPIINIPQVAILGVNTIIKRPAEIEKGVIGIVPFIGLSLTYDHRAIDGGPATKFLADIKYEIENFNTEII